MSQDGTGAAAVVGPNSLATVNTALNLIIGDLRSFDAGASRPSWIGAGDWWVKEISATQHRLMYYNGTTDVIMAEVNPTTGARVDFFHADATVTEYRAKAASRIITPAIAAAAAAKVTLADAATIAVDLALGFNFKVTLGGNRTLGNPTNVSEMVGGVIEVIQDGTGGRTLALGANWVTAGGVAPTFSTAAGAKDLIAFTPLGASEIFAAVHLDVK